jgi:nucleotide-binding universal stress UspA family protein
MMVLACQLATERNSSIDALYVIEVPLNLPIDASLPEERERARQVLERAAQAADMFKVQLTPVIVTARSAGRAIVETAIERRSEVIVLGSQGKRRIADKVFGRTIDYVLDNLPCEAIINVIPRKPAAGVALAGAAAAAGGTVVVSPGAGSGAVSPPEPAVARQVAASTGEAGAARRAQGLPRSRSLPLRPDMSGDGGGNGAGRPKESAGALEESPAGAVPAGEAPRKS